MFSDSSKADPTLSGCVSWEQILTSMAYFLSLVEAMGRRLMFSSMRAQDCPLCVFLCQKTSGGEQGIQGSVSPYSAQAGTSCSIQTSRDGNGHINRNGHTLLLQGNKIKQIKQPAEVSGKMCLNKKGLLLVALSSTGCDDAWSYSSHLPSVNEGCFAEDQSQPPEDAEKSN